MMVTKDMAQEWLKYNTDNRVPIRASIAHIVAMMDGGEWNEDAPCSVGFTRDRLIDGQHRLYALLGCSRATQFQMWVFINLPESVQQVIDSGKVRTTADRFGLEKRETACITWICRVRNSYNRRLLPSEVIAIRNEFRDAISWAGDWTSNKGVCRAQVQVAVMEMWMENPEKAEEFRSTLLGNGNGADFHHPAETLRRAIIRWIIIRRFPAQKDLYDYCKSACRAALEGRTLSKLYRIGAK
jgi:hypothetical protein